MTTGRALLRTCSPAASSQVSDFIHYTLHPFLMDPCCFILGRYWREKGEGFLCQYRFIYSIDNANETVIV